MRRASWLFGLGVMIAASGCDRLGFRDRELAACHPRCGDAGDTFADAGAGADAGSDAGADAGSASADSGAPDTGLPDLGAADATPAPDAAPLGALSSGLATPNTVEFAWDPGAVPADITSYELRVARDRATLERGGGELWGPDDDCALRARTRSGGDAVRSTRVLGLDPSTRYFGRLWGRRGADRVPLADGAADTTQVRSDEVRLFVDVVEAPVRREGFEPPQAAAETHEGTGALWVTDVVREAALIDLARVIPRGLEDRWATAYLEMFVRLTHPAAQPAACEVRVGLVGRTATRFSYRGGAIPGRAGWHRLQVPLPALLGPGAVPMSPAGAGGALEEFSVSALWPGDATIYFDDVTVFF